MKNRFLIFLALLPLFSFALSSDDFESPTVIRVYKFDRFSRVNDYDASYQTSSWYDSPLNSFENFTFGISFNSSGQLVIPSGSFSSFSTNGSASISFPIRSRLVGTTQNVWINPLLFDDVRSLFTTCVNLWLSGYRGLGAVNVSTFPNTYAVNFNYRSIVSDVLSSTNTVYRQLVLSYLSSLESSVKNIHVDLGQFQQDYHTVNYDYLNISNAIDTSVSLGVISSSRGDYFKDLISSAASDPDAYGDPVSLANSLFRSLKTLDSLSEVSSFLDSNPGSFNKFGRSFGDALGSGGSYHFTTPMTNALQKLNTNWVAQTKAALSNNTQQIKNQLDSMFGNPADSSTVGGGIANISRAAGSLAGTVNNNRVMVTVENATPVSVHLDGPINIDQSQFTQLSTPLSVLERRVDTWYQDWFSFFSPNVSGYNWIQFFDKVSSFKDVNHSDLVSIESCVSNLLVSFTSYTNELPFAISNAIAGLSLSSTNSYLLLSDYADYIHSGGLDSLLDVMDDDSYLDLKSEIVSLYHADTAEGYGRWWRYFTGLSTVQANSIFKLSNIFQAHEKLLKDLKRDNSDLEVQDASDSSVFRKLLYTIPSDEDSFNRLSQLTNSIDQSGMVSVQRLIPDLTNRFNVAASLYDKDFALPDEISWELIPADPSINSPARIVTIRPSEHYRFFQLLHFGLAFSYCLVNIILFPKFLLLLVRLFDRVWNKSEKLIFNSTQS